MSDKLRLKKIKKIKQIPDVIDYDIGYFLMSGFTPAPFNFLESASIPNVEIYSLPNQNR